MVEEFIHRLFCSRNAAHLAHWRTKSYAQHKALGSFYEDVIEQADEFVEAYMGASGKIIGEFEIPALKPIPDILKYLTAEVNWMNENRVAISGGVPALQNIVDDITNTYLSTIYKLKQLS